MSEFIFHIPGSVPEFARQNCLQRLPLSVFHQRGLCQPFWAGAVVWGGHKEAGQRQSRTGGVQVVGSLLVGRDWSQDLTFGLDPNPTHRDHMHLFRWFRSELEAAAALPRVRGISTSGLRHIQPIPPAGYGLLTCPFQHDLRLSHPSLHIELAHFQSNCFDTRFWHQFLKFVQLSRDPHLRGESR